MQVTAACITTQMYYLNRALDSFNTAIVTPLYYVMFTTATLVVSGVLFQLRQAPVAVAAEACGFAVVVAGTFLLHMTKDLEGAGGGGGVGSPTAASVIALGLRGGEGGGRGGGRGAAAVDDAAAGAGHVVSGGPGAVTAGVQRMVSEECIRCGVRAMRRGGERYSVVPRP